MLNGITMTIDQGEMISLMGASGSGKSTLMNILGCLDHPTSGTYLLEGHPITEFDSDERAEIRNKKIGFVFQSFNLLPRTSALDNVMMPLEYQHRRMSTSARRTIASELLDRLGLKDRMHHTPAQLSGGQQQRVAIARALVNRPSILFADEPTGNLDSHTSKEILAMFRRLNEEDRLTIMLVTHDAEVAAYGSRIIHILDGTIVDGAAVSLERRGSLQAGQEGEVP